MQDWCGCVCVCVCVCVVCVCACVCACGVCACVCVCVCVCQRSGSLCSDSMSQVSDVESAIRLRPSSPIMACSREMLR